MMMFQFFYVYIYVYLNVTEIANKKKTVHAKMHVNVVKCVVNLRAFFRLYMMVMVIIDTFIVCTNNILLNKPKQQVFIIFSLITSAKVIAEHNNRREISLDVEFYLLSILVQCITNQLSYSSAHFFFIFNWESWISANQRARK